MKIHFLILFWVKRNFPFHAITFFRINKSTNFSTHWINNSSPLPQPIHPHILTRETESSRENANCALTTLTRLCRKKRPRRFLSAVAACTRRLWLVVAAAKYRRAYEELHFLSAMFLNYLLYSPRWKMSPVCVCGFFCFFRRFIVIYGVDMYADAWHFSVSGTLGDLGWSVSTIVTFYKFSENLGSR